MKTKIFKVRLTDGLIQQDQAALDLFLAAHHVLTYETAFVKQEDDCYWSVILYYEEMQVRIQEMPPGKYAAEQEQLNEDEIKILDSLKLWRSEKAREKKIPVYLVATNKELLSIAKYRPAKKEELVDIKGFGKYKIENYGSEILEILEMV